MKNNSSSDATPQKRYLIPKRCSYIYSDRNL